MKGTAVVGWSRVLCRAPCNGMMRAVMESGGPACVYFFIETLDYCL